MIGFLFASSLITFLGYTKTVDGVAAISAITALFMTLVTGNVTQAIQTKGAPNANPQS